MALPDLGIGSLSLFLGRGAIEAVNYAVGMSPHEMLGALAGALKSGPWWMLTYQPNAGTE
jgi:hypothetical protein